MLGANTRFDSMSTKETTAPSTAQAKTKSEDVLKNYDQSEKIMLFVEAQRISRILENRISQIEIAVTLPDILRFNSASSIVDEELNKALEKHQLLAERLERERIEGLKQEAEGEDGEERKKAKTWLEKDIKSSVRHLLRLLRLHPDAISDLRAEGGVEARESECKLIKGLKMFHSQMVDKLLTSVDEELQLVLCKPSSSSPAHFLVHMAPVEENLAASIKSIDTKISQKNVEIKHLQESLDNARTTAQNRHFSYTYQKCQPQISEKQASMQQEIDQLNNQLDNLRRENKEAERALQEENKRLEAEIEDLLQKFDSDMEEKQAKLELNEIECEKEEEELRRLKEPFSILETEYNQIQERRRLAEEKRQEEMRELELKTKAVIFAQAWWRGYSTRKALKNKGKNKRAKKGKGKKK